LEKQIALFDITAFRVILRQQIAGYLRMDLGIYITIERANPFLKNWNIGRCERDDLDFRWWRWRWFLFAPVGKQNQKRKANSGNETGLKWP
jgi:hypothetical protein